MPIRMVLRQYAAISLIFGACLLIVEYSITSITMIEYYDNGDDNEDGGLRVGRAWQLKMNTASVPEDNVDDDVEVQALGELEESTIITHLGDVTDVDSYPWARENLLPVTTTTIMTQTTTMLDQESSTQIMQTPPTTNNSTTFLFWHISKSGGTSAKAIYRCLLGSNSVSVLSSRVDIGKATKAMEEEQQASMSFTGFSSSPPAFLSSFTSSFSPVQRTTPNVIFSMIPDLVATNIFNPMNKGRLLALFRHPVDRLVSKFYYLQTATWENGYKPHWQEKSLLSWAGKINRDNEHLVRALSGKHAGDTVTQLDLHRAKETARQYIFVGLTDHMEESIRRFNAIMGIHDADAVVNEDGTMVCMDEFFGKEGEEAVDGDGGGGGGGRRRMK
ncbi:hypothetical protein ACHAXH_009488, partial [Discostella pseudostelligera]